METIIVTGASSGFGEAIARRFLAEGYNVIAIARRKEKLMELSMDFPRKVHALAMDITDKYSVDECLDNIPEEFENIIALINNAGLSLGFGPAQDNDISDWETMVNTNILALLHITRRMLEIFKIKNQGHIINIGSVAAYYPYIGSNVYGATKSFVHNFTLNLKTDLEGTNIRASCVAPGLSKTEFAIVRFKGDVEKADSLYEKKTYLTADNIAETVFWTFSLPANVNINVLEVMPTGQSFALGFTKKQDGK
ncbi:NAD(P)-dependent oxidoreductase [Serratia marcescens]|uniref:SDR family NAD(P)-dependent oxidoreductase n=1 Tax=Serratia marcescens TaxID=615 RepID=UPI000D8664CD|nr:SDR family NAD(P)-dependent oxidoreductase [Serratia marcescens]PYA56562.1 NAD(P)-dependent oxidoreductase [Serratia marcescens]PYB14873.1 NAD(P)-dependent oxidoreductase [Serratia marcescens]